MKTSLTLYPPLLTRYLIAEHCSHEIYIGWHLYVRDSTGYQQRNADGDWGWLRAHYRGARSEWPDWLLEVLTQLGISMTGDGTMNHDAVAEIARRFPLPGRKVGGQRRGCIEVLEDYYGRCVLPAAGENLKEL